LPSAMRSLSYFFAGLMFIGNLLQFEFKEPLEEPEENKNKEDVLIIEEGSILNTKPLLNIDIFPQKDPSKENENICEKKKNVEKGELSQNETLNHTSYIDSDGYQVVPIKVVSSLTESMDEKKKLEKKNKEWSESSLDTNDERRCYSLMDAFHCRSTYFLMIMIYFSMANGCFMVSNFKNYGITKISSDSFLTLIGSLSSVCNGGGRLVWGFLSDKLEFKKTYVILLIIQIMEIATLRFISDYGVLYLIWVCGALLCEGGHFVLFPPLCLKVFGQNVGSKIYSILMLVCCATNLTQYGVNLALRPLIGYDNEFYIFMGFTIISLLICLLVPIKFGHN